MNNRALRVVAGVVLLVLAVVGLVAITTNDGRDRFGAAVVGGMAIGGFRLLQSTRG